MSGFSGEGPSTPLPLDVERLRLSSPPAPAVLSSPHALAVTPSTFQHSSGSQHRSSRTGDRSETSASRRGAAAALYTITDDRGGKTPSSAYQRWLETLPEPVDPAQRYRDELRSYPTGTARIARPVMLPMSDGNNAAATLGGQQTDAGPPTSFSKAEWGWLPAVPLNYKRNSMPPSTANLPRTPNSNKENMEMVSELPGSQAPTNQDDLPHKSQQTSRQSPQRRSPAKLQKKRPLSQDDESSSQQGPSKKSRIGSSFARSISRMSGRAIPAALDDFQDQQHQRRTGSALSRTLTNSRRRISGFFRPSSSDADDMGRSNSLASRQGLGFKPTSVGPSYARTREMLMRSDTVYGRPRALSLNDTTSGDFHLNIAFVGDATVGKSTLIRRFITGEAMYEEYVPTSTRDVHKILMNQCIGGVSCCVEVHDCGGGQEEAEISYLSQNWWDAVVICYSIGDPASLNSCTLRWIDDARANTTGVPVFLAGLKNDRRGPALQLAFLREQRIVSRHDGEEAAELIGAQKYVECSAKENKGVAELFYTVVNASLPRVISNERRAEAAHSKKHDFMNGASRMFKGLLRTTHKTDGIT